MLGLANPYLVSQVHSLWIQKTGPLSFEALQTFLQDRRKRKMAFLRKKARALKGASRSRTTQTRSEYRLVPSLRDLGFRYQWIIWPYVVDFCHRQAKVVVEVDGKGHRPIKDRRRDQSLGRRGYKVLRVQNQEVWGNLEGVVEKCRLLLESR